MTDHSGLRLRVIVRTACLLTFLLVPSLVLVLCCGCKVADPTPNRGTSDALDIAPASGIRVAVKAGQEHDAFRLLDEFAPSHSLVRGEDYPGMEEVRWYAHAPRYSDINPMVIRVLRRGPWLDVDFGENYGSLWHEGIADLRRKFVTRFGEGNVRLLR